MMVEAYVASWIEIATAKYFGCSDKVEAYVASWIEMVQQILVFARIVPSRLMWPRGLKYRACRECGLITIVEAYVASWIEIWILGVKES